uniref:Tudor domain-containing protein n=1 Tax=Rhabditophanes sp. KR3021 TaxID=114890 RepID=A0AC35UG84_9BILA
MNNGMETLRRKSGIRDRSVEVCAWGSKYKIARLRFRSELNVEIVRVESPSLVYVRLTNHIANTLTVPVNSPTLRKIDMESCLYHRNGTNQLKGYINRYCLAPFRKDCFARCRIVENNKNDSKYVKVFFVDFAISAYVRKSCLAEMDVEWHLIPAQVMAVSVSCLVPNKEFSKKWTRQFVNHFRKFLTRYKTFKIVKTFDDNDNRVRVYRVNMLGLNGSRDLIGEDVAYAVFVCLFDKQRIKILKSNLDVFEVEGRVEKIVMKDYHKKSIFEGQDEKDEDEIYCPIINVQGVDWWGHKKYEEGPVFSVAHFLKPNIVESIPSGKDKQTDKQHRGRVDYRCFKQEQDFYKSIPKKITPKVNLDDSFASYQIPIWTKHMLTIFSNISPKNQMLIEVIPSAESFNLSLKNPFEMHAFILRYEKEEETLFDENVIQYAMQDSMREREAWDIKMHAHYNTMDKLIELDQDKILFDLMKGNRVYAVKHEKSDYGAICVERVEILSVQIEEDETLLRADYLFERVKIRRIDKGGILIVSIDCLAVLSKEMSYLPPFTIQIILDSLKEKVLQKLDNGDSNCIGDFFSYFNSKIAFKKPMICSYVIKNGSDLMFSRKEKVYHFENKLEWEYNHVINVCELRNIWPDIELLDDLIDVFGQENVVSCESKVVMEKNEEEV